MEIMAQDRKDGYMKLGIESDSDLWHLKHVVGSGDTLRMRDQRTTIEGGEKQSGIITLQVEKTEYQGNRLRATGEITEAPENVTRGYHTFNLEAGVTVEIWKEEWQDHQLDRIKTAAETKDYEVVVCVLDKDEATVAQITEQGMAELATVHSGRSGKQYDSDDASGAYYGRIASILQDHADADRIIVAGPGFEKEHLQDFLDDNHADIAGNLAMADASSAGMPGVQEVIKRGAVKRVRQESRVADEVAAVEDLLKHLNKDDGLAAYGLEPVEHAVELGAVEQLLISDVLVQRQEDLVARVEQQDGQVQLVHEDHDAGKKLAALGGIAAVLRYEID